MVEAERAMAAGMKTETETDMAMETGMATKTTTAVIKIPDIGLAADANATVTWILDGGAIIHAVTTGTTAPTGGPIILASAACTGIRSRDSMNSSTDVYEDELQDRTVRARADIVERCF